MYVSTTRKMPIVDTTMDMDNYKPAAKTLKLHVVPESDDRPSTPKKLVVQRYKPSRALVCCDKSKAPQSVDQAQAEGKQILNFLPHISPLQVILLANISTRGSGNSRPRTRRRENIRKCRLS